MCICIVDTRVSAAERLDLKSLKFTNIRLYCPPILENELGSKKKKMSIEFSW